MSWADRKPTETRSNELGQLPRIEKTRIRRKIGARGFFHKGRVVEEGQIIECDADIARTLVDLGKAERV